MEVSRGQSGAALSRGKGEPEAGSMKEGFFPQSRQRKHSPRGTLILAFSTPEIQKNEQILKNCFMLGHLGGSTG